MNPFRGEVGQILPLGGDGFWVGEFKLEVNTGNNTVTVFLYMLCECRSAQYM